MDNQRFIDIETKLAYQEDLIQELNKTVHSQQLKLEQLEQALRSLSMRYNSLAEQGDSDYPVDEKPPHY
ncbi:MAG: SlyX family protein [Gammaproteobacteria bacterium]|jgi:SlyX protein